MSAADKEWVLTLTGGELGSEKDFYFASKAEAAAAKKAWLEKGSVPKTESVARPGVALSERRRARSKSRRAETLADMLGKIQMFGKTQGRVASSYKGRLATSAGKESLSDDRRKKLGRLQGVMDQLDSVMREIENAVKV